MLIKKLIEISIDINRPMAVYSNPYNNLLNILKDRFEGTCYASCFITNVVKIKRQSECIINQESIDCFGRTSLEFEVDAIVYNKDEIINGCKITNIDKSGIIICETEIASIYLSSHVYLQSLKKDQIISIKVGMAKYTPVSNKISINATPHFFETNPIYYHISPKIPTISDNDKDFFNAYIIQINKELENKKKILDIKWKFFNKLLYAYKNTQSVPTNAKSFNILNIFKDGEINMESIKPLIGKYLCRDPKINMLTPDVYVYVSINDTLPVTPETDWRHAVIAVLDNYLNHLITIREMSNIYDGVLLSSHENLWKIYKKLKITNV